MTYASALTSEVRPTSRFSVQVAVTNRLDETADLAFWERIADDYDADALATRVPAILDGVRQLWCHQGRPSWTLAQAQARLPYRSRNMQRG